MTKLKVTINGSIINGKNGQEIFQNSLLRLVSICGENEVISADKEGNCISKNNLRRQVKPKKIDKYYISTHHGNTGKASFLKKLNEHLSNVILDAEVLD